MQQDITGDNSGLSANSEKLSGIVQRVTFHNPENGWSVLRVSPLGRSRSFGGDHDHITVTIHQSKVFAGATVDFFGHWTQHPKFGQQFKALQMVERRPATASALEKYLGSGLIHGVGPKTAQKIVKHFGAETLDIFENEIGRLTEIRGIAEEKLKQIKSAWKEHREIRNVMMFLQSYGISTLFAVKIYKTYGDKAIEIVRSNPYQLSKDIYGVGFFSADKVALQLGFKEDSEERIGAAIKHVLMSSKEEGHCYLTYEQVEAGVAELLAISVSEKIQNILMNMEEQQELKVRLLPTGKGPSVKCYYSKSTFFDELFVSKKIKQMREMDGPAGFDQTRVESWIDRYCSFTQIALSEEQRESVIQIVQSSFSVLTGGPGCGKTTTTKVLVKLLVSMGRRVILAAPTGRAAQRMSEVIGLEAKTIHRLLVWNPQVGGFKKNEENPLEGDFFIFDECSMLDINLTASLLKAIPEKSQVLFIGDADQLPSVGAGNVLKDIIDCQKVNCYKLTKIFRQAEASLIIKYAHQINQGLIPQIESPIPDPGIWANILSEKKDCLFIDSDEMTQEQAKFVMKVKSALSRMHSSGVAGEERIIQKVGLRGGKESFERMIWEEDGDWYCEKVTLEDRDSILKPDLVIPKKYHHVELERLLQSQEEVDYLKTLLKKVHPWSSLNYGWTASEVVKRLYMETIPRHLGKDKEIQILSPMVRGTLGTYKLNESIQNAVNPFMEGKSQIKLGEKIFRAGDRVIQRRNNYDLGVFNGDIGVIRAIDAIEMQMVVEFGAKGEQREVVYEKENMAELELAYAITIHKSQGSEFDVVIIPVMTQHFKMLFRNLIYTGLTRAKKLAVFVGTRKAFSLSIRNYDPRIRQTALKHLLQKK